MKTLYVDGGVYKHNPSNIGGAWAYVLVEDGNILKRDCGVIVGEVTNNYMEFYAAYMGIKNLPDGWAGTFISDSKITIGRIFYGWKTRGLPEELVSNLKKELANKGLIIPKHVKGHQNYNGDADIFYNRMCDTMCNQIMSETFK